MLSLEKCCGIVICELELTVNLQPLIWLCLNQLTSSPRSCCVAIWATSRLGRELKEKQKLRNIVRVTNLRLLVVQKWRVSWGIGSCIIEENQGSKRKKYEVLWEVLISCASVTYMHECSPKPSSRLFRTFVISNVSRGLVTLNWAEPNYHMAI